MVKGYIIVYTGGGKITEDQANIDETQNNNPYTFSLPFFLGMILVFIHHFLIIKCITTYPGILIIQPVL